jgi:hypothetical protein
MEGIATHEERRVWGHPGEEESGFVGVVIADRALAIFASRRSRFPLPVEP